jgi:DNA-binding response OmpR family regulator
MKPPSESTILIVDDNLQNLKILLGFLNDSGFDIYVAKSGEETLTLVNRFRPDIILLDVMMPGLDGFETCRRLKANNETRQIPVIFMTALNDVESKVEGFEAGGVDFITKPVELQEVLARVTTHLTLRHLQTSLQQKNDQLQEVIGQLQERNRQLQEALDNVKTLRELLPICANCKRIRDDRGYWHQLESYFHTHAEIDFTHGICPDCAQELYPDVYSTIAERRDDIIIVLEQAGPANLESIAASVGFSESITLSRLLNLIREGRVQSVEIDGEIYYRIPSSPVNLG